MTKLLNKKWKVKIMKQILLVCNAGMSTSMLVKKMQQSATERGIEISIQAKSMTEAKKKYP
ncbi:PTS system transporter subunit IIB [Streptococcus pneumoniae]|nr:PTS system transporter subunit IIB [Streptococcus pneumoniae]